MKRLLISALSIAAFAFPVYANEASITESVNLYSFNPADNTYSAQVTVSAQICKNVSYNIPLDVSGVKDENDAREKVKDKAEKIKSDIRKSAEECGAH